MTVLLFLIVGFFWQILQKDFVIARMTMNVTRSSSESTSDYQYHGFYRLQADERFADTVVRWMQSPRIMHDTYATVNIAPFDDFMWPMRYSFQAERLSSQIIDVRFPAHSDTEARVIAQSLTDRINDTSQSLNKDQQESAWFEVVHDVPVSQSGTLSLSKVLGIALFLGVFCAFWLVLYVHYMSRRKELL